MLQLTIEQRAENVRKETKRRMNATTLQDVIVRLIDDRQRYRFATRSTTGSYRVVANTLVLDRVLSL